jgi:hypothetical protein
VGKIAKEIKIHYSNLSTYIAKLKKQETTEDRFAPTDSEHETSRLVFSSDSVRKFASYLKNSNEMRSGLTPMEV